MLRSTPRPTGALFLATATALAVVAGAGAALALEGAEETATPGPTTLADRPPLILPGAPPDLLAFHTGDVIGYVTPCG